MSSSSNQGFMLETKTLLIGERTMGVACTTISMKATEPEVNNSILSEGDRKLIRHSWRYLSNHFDLTELGCDVFLKIFELNPEVKNMFPCRDVEGEDLLRNADFKGHASR